MNITNDYNVNILVAAWLLSDDYDYVNDPNYYSVTSLMKPTKQVILARRVPADLKVVDVSAFAASRRGAAIHDSIENIWKSGQYRVHLPKMGVPQAVINRIVVNPTSEQLETVDGIIPVYFEQRLFKQLGKFTLGGKFDVVADGVVEDFKTTSVFKFMKGDTDGKYRRQLSSYRYLGPHLITEPYGRINFLFSDWQGREAKTNVNYPAIPLATTVFELESPEVIEAWAIERMTQLDQLKDAPEEQLPRCTDEELWRSAPVYKYYSDPTKVIGGRSTKNFTDPVEAKAFHDSKGGKGVLITVPGEVKACAYCPAFPVCKQREEYQ